jgi:hypothetical protein
MTALAYHIGNAKAQPVAQHSPSLDVMRILSWRWTWAPEIRGSARP